MSEPRRALVTGDLGFVGRHMRARLEADGWTVYGFDIKREDTARPDHGRHDARDWFRNAGHTNWGFDLVVHCAALVGGRATIEGNPLAIAVDLAIDAELFQWAMRCKVKPRVVYYSSSAAYPVRLQKPEYHVPLSEGCIDLDWIETPDLTYGWAKLTGEMLAVHARAAGVPVTVLRPFSGYGADQDLDYPFPSFIERARNHEDPFVIWGDGRQVRDWVHIDDVIGATLAAVEAGVDGPLNIGWGRPTTFLELKSLVCEAVGYTPHVELVPDAPAGVAWRVSEPTAMLDLYKPTVTLEEGIDRALRGA